MKDNKEKWIEEVFESLEGSQRANAPVDLFSKIEQNLYAPEAKIIPLRSYRMAIAAAVTLLIVNVFALYQITQPASFSGHELVVEETQSLISDFKLYDL